MAVIITVFSGTAFILGALFFFWSSRKQMTSDIVLWSLFVLTHGFHEIVEYLIEINSSTLTPTLAYFAELTEISLFAISGVLLVVASLQRTNRITPPWSYYIGLALLFPILYFTWLPGSEVFDLIHKTITIGFIETNLHRILFGFLFGMVPVIVFSFLSLKVIKTYSKFPIPSLRGRRYRSILATIAALVFMIFEGIVIENPDILIVKALAALLILIIPVDIILTESTGLKFLIVFDSAGRMLFGHNFTKGKDEDELTIISGFMSALKTFSSEEIDQGQIKTLQSANGTLLFAHKENLTAGLLVKNYSPHLDQSLNQFLTTFLARYRNDLEKMDQLIDLAKFEQADQIVMETFLMFT